MEKTFKILSIDGGGIRGIYPATVIKYISDQLKVDNFYEYFDMIVGTSTGSILALALSIGKNCTELQDMYLTHGNRIFNKKSYRWLNQGIFFTKYSNNVLKRILNDYFGNHILNDAKTRICIPVSDVTNKKGKVYKTRHCGDFFNDYSKLMQEIALSSCSAPVYFPAVMDSSKSILVDGGLWANNPSVIGITEAIRLRYDYENIRLFSIGTGTSLFFKSSFFLRHFGFISWRTSLIDYIFQINSNNSHHVAKFLLKDNYLRINRQLENKSFKLDRSSKNLMHNLISYANEDSQTNIKEIKEKFFEYKVEPFKPIPINEGE